MANTHRVKQGECLSSIAARHGITNPLVIYNHTLNDRLRRQRPSPEILMPGDEIFIPAPERRKENAGTQVRHRFIRKVNRTRLRIVILDELHKPAVNVKYLLTIAGRNIEGETDQTGCLDEVVSSDSVDAVLIVWLPLRANVACTANGACADADRIAVGREIGSEGNLQKHVFKLKIGCLDPIDEVTGIQARLTNLGYRVGKIDGVFGEKTAAAVRRFQREQGLSQDNALTQSLRQRIVNLHGC